VASRVLGVPLGEYFAGLLHQVGVALEQVAPGHPVADIGNDAEVLDRLAARALPNPERTPQGHTEPGARGQRLERTVGPVGQDGGELPDVRAAGTGVVVRAQDSADLVVLEPGREGVVTPPSPRRCLSRPA
jgi:hypothetical protein